MIYKRRLSPMICKRRLLSANGVCYLQTAFVICKRREDAWLRAFVREPQTWPVYMHICMCVCEHVAFPHAYAYMCVYIYTYIYIYIHTYIHTSYPCNRLQLSASYTRTYIHIHTYIHTYIRRPVRTNSCSSEGPITDVCMYTFIHLCINTFIASCRGI